MRPAGALILEGVEIVLLVPEALDLPVDGIGVHGPHVELPEIIFPIDRPTGLIRFEQEREQIDELSILNMGVTRRCYTV